MHPIEKTIFKQIVSLYSSFDVLGTEVLDSLPLGTLSPQFYNDVRVKQYSELHKDSFDEKKRFCLRLALEHYLGSGSSAEYLKPIETALLNLPGPINSKKKTFLQNKAAGTYLLPISSDLIRQVYQLGDIPLMDLFKKQFPIPTQHLFAKGTLPEVIREREIAVLKTMATFDIKTIEPSVIKIQRYVRRNQRYQEEINRIAYENTSYLEKHAQVTETLNPIEEKNDPIPEKMHLGAKKLIQDANTPYKPKCDLELSERIMAAAKKVTAFSTVKHITSAQAIQSIFNDALYGRRTLMDFYLSFKPASLLWTDILNGDANVVCLGPEQIDPSADGNLIIEFYVSELIKNKPAAFFKQRDLEYERRKIRTVQLGEKTLSFDHTGSYYQNSDRENIYLKLSADHSDQFTHIAMGQKSSFIAYNLEQMHEILTLNFFRFIDKAVVFDNKTYHADFDHIDHAYIDDFYQNLSRLTDEELLLFLTDLAKNMTDTAEFNFYGAYQIDYSAIINITVRDKEYTLNILQFIHDLKQGTLDSLRQARIMIPELFKSYRFVDYLLQYIQHPEARYYLDDLRKLCQAPQWVQYTALRVPEGFELHWDIFPEHDACEQKSKESVADSPLELDQHTRLMS